MDYKPFVIKLSSEGGQVFEAIVGTVNFHASSYKSIYVEGIVISKIFHMPDTYYLFILIGLNSPSLHVVTGADFQSCCTGQFRLNLMVINSQYLVIVFL